MHTIIWKILDIFPSLKKQLAGWCRPGSTKYSKINIIPNINNSLIIPLRRFAYFVVYLFFFCVCSLILLFLLSSSVLSYFNLAVPMRKCLGKHSCMSSSFSIVILNGTCSLRAPILLSGDVPAIQQLNYKQIFSLVGPAWPIRSVEQHFFYSSVLFVPKVLCPCYALEHRDCLAALFL